MEQGGQGRPVGLEQGPRGEMAKRESVGGPGKMGAIDVMGALGKMGEIDVMGALGKVQEMWEGRGSHGEGEGGGELLKLAGTGGEELDDGHDLPLSSCQGNHKSLFVGINCETRTLFAYLSHSLMSLSRLPLASLSPLSHLALSLSFPPLSLPFPSSSNTSLASRTSLAILSHLSPNSLTPLTSQHCLSPPPQSNHVYIHIHTYTTTHTRRRVRR